MTAEVLQKVYAPSGEGNTPRKKKICFVCSGNTCRSPMAAAVANALAAENVPGREGLPEAYCAGISAVEGDPISMGAVKALEAAGISPVPGRDYHDHRAHLLTEEEAERYDLLIGMTGRHVLSMMMAFPQLTERIYCMPHEISDPFGGDAEEYRRSLEQIVVGVRLLLLPGETR